MSVTTFEGIVENGQIRLPDNIQLPEQTKVYVVIPARTAEPPTPRLISPRLAHPEQAKDFQKTLIHDASL